ncbi:unnamed protein product [Nesidiocoris tenuis]|uniref:Uncharacterized protein n=1 Tax=Nesidiocoris tenuis TaxID=355587 RepID=A0A6H5G4R7_9HEMI|nr:unnamed protein product [Nesidiocoris tenuis]
MFKRTNASIRCRICNSTCKIRILLGLWKHRDLQSTFSNIPEGRNLLQKSHWQTEAHRRLEQGTVSVKGVEHRPARVLEQRWSWDPRIRIYRIIKKRPLYLMLRKNSCYRITGHDRGTCRRGESRSAVSEIRSSLPVSRREVCACAMAIAIDYRIVDRMNIHRRSSKFPDRPIRGPISTQGYTIVESTSTSALQRKTGRLTGVSFGSHWCVENCLKSEPYRDVGATWRRKSHSYIVVKLGSHAIIRIRKATTLTPSPTSGSALRLLAPMDLSCFGQFYSHDSRSKIELDIQVNLNQCIDEIEWEMAKIPLRQDTNLLISRQTLNIIHFTSGTFDSLLDIVTPYITNSNRGHSERHPATH